jgi:transcription elongation factor Elf1
VNIIKVYENFTKVYGPYTRKDNRQIVILRDDHHNQLTVSYPKYIVECALNRYLESNETVDHIDEDVTNNDLSNLRIVPRGIHAASHVPRRVVTGNEFNCPVCGKRCVATYDRRKTCGSKQCVGASTHLLGYNKGNEFVDNYEGTVSYASHRFEVDNYPSVAELLQTMDNI